MVDRDAMRRFVAAVERPEPELELDRCSLLVGDWDRSIDVARYRQVLDRLADAADLARDEMADRSFAGARAVSRVLFVERGFKGNLDDYYDPRNSFLGDVLDRRLGIPITLSVLYMEIARRIGARVSGIGFPGHFLIRAYDDDRAVVIDPFHHGAVLGKDDLQALLARAAGPDAKLEPTMLQPIGKLQILQRMLVNLAGIYGKRGDLFRSLEVLERLAVLDRDNAKLAQELETLRERCAALN